MFSMYFPKPIHSVNITQLDDSTIQANFYIHGEICFQQLMSIYSFGRPNRVEDPERVFAREQWNNLI
jgi:hypothetical protein